MTDLPLALVAELTHRCPLHCPYCSNPLALTRPELDTSRWLDVFRQAGELGIVQLQLSGGEPLLRDDLERLVAYASALGLYTHLVTSGVGLDASRLHALEQAGLRSIQISLQADEARLADRIAGRKAHAQKLAALAAVTESSLALTLNVVVHALNIGRLAEMVSLCERFEPHRIELANVQYYGWAMPNRAALMPSREQVAEAVRVYDRLRARLEPVTEVIWVLPDYHEQFPKPCMGGWGRTSLTVTPDGTVLPCLAAAQIVTLTFESVRDRPLAAIWHDSAAFNAFRGTGWMQEPCRSCERRFADHGGCRCQAFLLTGDAARTDPVCSLSPDRHMVSGALAERGTHRRLRYRRFERDQSNRTPTASEMP